MSMVHHIEAIVAEEFQRETGHKIARLARSRPGHGDFQSNAAMEIAGKIGRPASEIAQAVCERLKQSPQIAEAQVAGNGFINIRISNHFLEVYALQSHIHPSHAGQTIIIDFGSPNVAKPLHVGHLRSLVIGESLQRIFLALGAKVISDVHFGDWGLQMGMLISEIEAAPSTEWQTAEHLVALYPKVAAACAADPNRMALAQEATARLQNGGDENALIIWERICSISQESQLRDFKRLGANFSLLLGESDAHEHIPGVIERAKGLSEVDDGALILRVSKEGDTKEVPPLLLVKSDGSYLYGTTDLATVAERMTLSPDRILYVVDQRQNLHFEQVFRAAHKLGFTTKQDGSTTELVHVGFGTVNDKSGKAYKTRDGGVALLSDLLDQAVAKAAERAPSPEAAEKIGVGAVKYADLNTWRISGYKFDLDRMLSFEGKTGPYVQYACVRMRAIFEKTPAPIDWRFRITVPEERALLMACLDFQTKLETAAERYAPNEIAEYAFNLAQEFSRFYTNCPVLGAPEERERLCLCALTFHILSKCLELLGIEVPERM
jgi:arginyl-tRNA synthetase